MSLKDKLMDDVKAAMKSGDKVRKDTLGLMRAALQNAQIEKRAELTGAEELAVIKSELKRTEEALIDFKKAKREDLITLNETKIEVIRAYLPAELTEEETLGLALSLGIKKGDIKGPSTGKIMKAANGRANAQIVGKVLDEILA